VAVNSAKCSITVVWPADGSMATREMFVIVDGKEVGELAHGNALELTLSPGHHRLSVTNRLFTRTLEFDIGEGDRLRFAAGVQAAGCFSPLAVLLGTPTFAVSLRQE
jgi:hypothetical protein